MYLVYDYNDIYTIKLYYTNTIHHNSLADNLSAYNFNFNNTDNDYLMNSELN